MVTGKTKVNLEAEEILKHISEYDIYRYFVGEDFKLGKIMQSPMPGRKDNHPSFIIGAKGGFLYHHDFADSRYRGNCFQFVMQKEMLPFHRALQKIDKEFNLGIGEPMTEVNVPVFIQPLIEDTKPKFFQVEYTKKFNAEETAYWNQFHISVSECVDNEIFAVRRYWIDRKLQPMRKLELTFGYRLGSLWKIYRPYACKDRKWKNNIPNSSIEGIERVGIATKGIITKSRKDRVVLQKFLGSVVSVQNESLQALTPENAEILRENWANIYVNYDADAPGKLNSHIVTAEYGFKHLNVPDFYMTEGIKDFADLIRIYGPDKVYKYLKQKEIV